MAVKILDAATDGVTSEWTVPLDSGPATSRDHATVIVSIPAGAVDYTLTFADGADNAISPNSPGADHGPQFYEASYQRYRDALSAIWYRHLDTAQVNPVDTGGAWTGTRPAAVQIRFVSDGVTPFAPPTGGHLEVWVG